MESVTSDHSYSGGDSGGGGGGALSEDTDTDTDGLYDWWEDKYSKDRNGNVVLDKNNPDTDGDGTPDGEEDFDYTSKINNGKSLPDGIQNLKEQEFGGNPHKPDIFVEVDRMIRGAREDALSFIVALVLITIIIAICSPNPIALALAVIFAPMLVLWFTFHMLMPWIYDTFGHITHKLHDKSQDEVKDAFKDRGINLHIDDDDAIPYDEFVAWVNDDTYTGGDGQAIGTVTLDWLDNKEVTTTKSIQGMFNGDANNDGTSDGDDYFTQSRKGVYRYCVLGHYAGYTRGSSGAKPHGRAAMSGRRGIQDQSDEAGDFFVVWGKAMTKDYWLSGHYKDTYAAMWMHELGHCLLLNADAIYADSSDNPIDDDTYPSCMRYGRDHGDKGYIDYSNKAGTVSGYNGGTALPFG